MWPFLSYHSRYRLKGSKQSKPAMAMPHER